ncbi:hypothetical protein Lalb_Chr20g0111841 [Lupinus albus]|uniref:Uncharacterized protein n=1 Tax=Lupinus albus TaxID=3870 RepID=A0A6A4NWF8_LUPAL|nr:hypothetical protein Lalb_Chr20g0111841 [Lupinus albus]
MATEVNRKVSAASAGAHSKKPNKKSSFPSGPFLFFILFYSFDYIWRNETTLISH